MANPKTHSNMPMKAGLNHVIGSWSMLKLVGEITKNGLVLSATGNFSGFSLQNAVLGFLFQSVRSKITYEFVVSTILFTFIADLQITMMSFS